MTFNEVVGAARGGGRGGRYRQRRERVVELVARRPRRLRSTQDDYEGAKEELEKFVEQTRTLHADQLTLKGTS